MFLILLQISKIKPVCIRNTFRFASRNIHFMGQYRIKGTFCCISFVLNILMASPYKKTTWAPTLNTFKKFPVYLTWRIIRKHNGVEGKRNGVDNNFFFLFSLNWIQIRITLNVLFRLWFKINANMKTCKTLTQKTWNVTEA